mmetsp:Transcript_61418/g.73878  ORF Transcript_61418/g.73878 Transcript_61418/m.73878 type:complete len:370 (+) Transcript_61418:45-1154(+)|eukprot:CAMPEP_0194385444 /NCGR_PEP_ID=MMETSP0174-20130528/80422_1 /TAXON_ID=216777 /ORGANISM="Proboscia alata, Strain PI-D3" /LENGTH=369 /DNA_ID=CAMNT_0039173619 /DNA_START=44 /DNA_END=1153 /DNA_ORIENTATION=+
MSAPEARALSDPPTDGITSLCYLPQSSINPSLSLLACSSWDGCLRVYDTKTQANVVTHSMDSRSAAPLLSLAVPPSPEGILVAGSLNGLVQHYDIKTSTSTIIGAHCGGEQRTEQNACSCLAPIDCNVVASAGWDSKFHLWDLRIGSSGEQNKPVASHDLPGKAFSMDTHRGNEGKNTVVIATSGRRNCIIDMRVLSSEKAHELNEPIVVDLVPQQNRESSLKYQTRAVRLFPDGKGMALSSIEGRVAIEYLDEAEAEKTKKKKYAFKCHRVGDTIYPVNAIAFHPRFGTFATGGCDGTVVLWDAANKKRLTALPKMATSIAALAYNHDGTELAMASSYTFEEGERDHPRDEIYVREILDHESKPKNAK